MNNTNDQPFHRDEQGWVRFDVDLEPIRPWETIELSGVREILGEDDEREYQQCHDDIAEFWTLYLRYAPDATGGRGVDCLADFQTKQDAQAWRQFLLRLARAFGHPENKAEVSE